jgi:hypothetical protein
METRCWRSELVDWARVTLMLPITRLQPPFGPAGLLAVLLAADPPPR